MKNIKNESSGMTGSRGMTRPTGFIEPGRMPDRRVRWTTVCSEKIQSNPKLIR
jgi:hypothetical protein